MNIATLLCLAIFKAVEVFLWAKHVSGSRNNYPLCGMQIICCHEEHLRLLLSRSVMQLKSFFEFRPLQRAYFSNVFLNVMLTDSTLSKTSLYIYFFVKRL